MLRSEDGVHGGCHEAGSASGHWNMGSVPLSHSPASPRWHWLLPRDPSLLPHALVLGPHRHSQEGCSQSLSPACASPPASSVCLPGFQSRWGEHTNAEVTLPSTPQPPAPFPILMSAHSAATSYIPQERRAPCCLLLPSPYMITSLCVLNSHLTLQSVHIQT